MMWHCPVLLSLLLCLAPVAEASNFSVVLRKASDPFFALEGAESAFAVHLSDAPRSPVVVAIVPADNTTTVVNAQLSFDDGDWHSPKNFLIKPTRDFLLLDSPYNAPLHLSVSSASNVSNVLVRILVQNSDRADVVLAKSSAFPYPTRIPEGRSAVFFITLASKPLADVNVTLSFNSHITVVPSFLQFTPDTWNASRSIEVFANRDSTRNFVPPQEPIRFAFTSPDAKFDGAPVTPFPTLIEDSDTDAFLRQATVSWTSVQTTALLADVEFLIELAFDAAMPAAYLLDGSTINFPSVFSFGDGVSAAVNNFTIVQNVSQHGAVYALARVEHRYALSPAPITSIRAQFEQCCRSARLNNNQLSRRALRITLNIPNLPRSGYGSPATRASSPTAPPFLLFGLGHSSSSNLQPRLVAAAGDHPLAFRVAGPEDFGDGSCSQPPGLTVDENSGLLSWDTSLVPLGGTWSALVMIKDLVNGNEIPLEFLIQTFPTAVFPLLPGLPAHIFAQVNTDLSIPVPWAADHLILPLHTLPNAVVVNASLFAWRPTSSQLGDNFLCFSSIHANTQQPSDCNCLVIEVVHSLPSAVNITPQFLNLAFVKNANTSLALVRDLQLALDSAITLATIQLHGAKDESLEYLTHSVPSWSPLRVVQFSTSSMTLVGLGGISTYLSALRTVHYFNDATRPTVGFRSVTIEASIGGQLVRLLDIQIDVIVQNAAPLLDLDTTNPQNSDFATLFTPLGPEVFVANSPDMLSLRARDRDIMQGYVHISNCFDFVNESLRVTYQPPPTLDEPLVVENMSLYQMFGNIGAASTQSQVIVASDHTVSRIDVIVYLNHSFIGDITIELVHAGTVVPLVLFPGGRDCPADDMVGTVFSTSSTISLGVSSNQPGVCMSGTSGVFAPTGDLHGMTRLPTSGPWLLRVNDLSPDEDNGVLLGWALVFHPLVTPSPNVVFSSQPSVSAAQSSRLMVDCNLSGRILDMHLSVQLQSDNFRATSLRLVHPDGTSIQLASAGQLLASTSYLLFTRSNTSRPMSGFQSRNDTVSVLSPPSHPSWAVIVDKQAKGQWSIVASTSSPSLSVKIFAAQIEFTLAPFVFPRFDNASCTLFLEGRDTDEHYREIISSVVYQNYESAPNSTLRILEVQVHDGNQPSNLARSFMSIQHMRIVQLASIMENDFNSSGDRILSIVKQAVPAEEGFKVPLTQLGVAIVGADQQNGHWEFSLNDGAHFISLSQTSLNSSHALVLVGNSSVVRFVPHRYFHEYATIDFVLWDLTRAPISSGTFVNLAQYPVATGPVSVASSVAFIQVRFVNNRPSLAPGSTLLNISEDQFDNPGTAVGLIVSRTFSDPNRATPSGFDTRIGVAVVGVDRRFGDWLYSCDGAPFTPFIGGILENGAIFPANPTPQKATLLADTCFIKFLPNFNFNSERFDNGTLRDVPALPFILMRAWDQTQGFSGQITINTTKDDENGAFSVAIEAASIFVIDVNKPPTLDLGSGSADYVLNFRKNSSALPPLDPLVLNVSDIDNSTLVSAFVHLPRCFDPGFEFLFFRNDYLLTAQPLDNSTLQLSFPQYPDWSLNVTYLSVTDSIAMVFTSVVPAPLASYQTALRHLVYVNYAMEPNNSSRHIDFVLFDGSQNSTTRRTNIVTVLFDGFAPIITANVTNFSFYALQDNLSLTSTGFSLYDMDNNNFFFMHRAVVRQIGPEFVPFVDFLSVSTAPGIVQSYNQSTGVLSLEGAAPVLVYEQVLQTLVFQNFLEQPPPFMRVIEMVVFDSVDRPSEPVLLTIHFILVNANAPVVTNLPAFVLVENEDTFAAVGRSINITDLDSGDFPVPFITIALQGCQSLQFERIFASGSSLINVSYDTASSMLTFSGPAKLRDYLPVIRTTNYSNTMIEPNDTVRILNITIFDGVFVSSFSSSIQWLLRNDAPQLIVASQTVDFLEGAEPVPVFRSDFNLSDSDSPTLVALYARLLTAPDHFHEVLAGPSWLQQVGLSASYEVSTYTLAIVGNASRATYQDVITNITYRNFNAYPGNPVAQVRVVSLFVDDGANVSNIVNSSVRVIPVNDAPIVYVGASNASNFSTSFTEDGPAVFAASSRSFLFDLDNISLAEMRVEILNVLDVGFESLALSVNASNVTMSSLALVSASTVCHRLCVDSFHAPLDAAVPFADTLCSNVCTLGSSLMTSAPHASCTQVCSQLDAPNWAALIRERPLLMTLLINTSRAPGNNTRSNNNSIDDSSGDSIEYDYDLNGSSWIFNNVSSVDFWSDMISNWTGPLLCQFSCTLAQRAGTSLWVAGVSPQHDFDALMKAVTYRNTRDEPDYTPRQIVFAVSDGLSFSTPVFSSMTMVPVNDAPVLRLSREGPHFNTTFVEKQQPVAITNFSDIVRDVDDANMSRVIVTLLNGVDGAYEGIYLANEAPQNRPFSSPSVYDILFREQRGLIPGQQHYPLQQHFELVANKDKAEFNSILSSLVYVNTHHNLTWSVVRNISFQIFDASGLSSNIVFTSVQLVPVNDPPLVNYTTATAQVVLVEDDPPYTFVVLRDYFDAEERPTTAHAWLSQRGVVLVRPAEYGVVSIDMNGSLTYAPLLWDYGNRSFVYKVCDAQGLCSVDFVVGVSIARVNNAPMAAGPLFFSIEEDTVNQINLDQFVFDVEDYQREPFKSAVDGSSLLTITLPEDQPSTVGMMSVSLRGHVLIFTPMQYYVGNSSVQFIVCDSEGSCSTFYLIVNVRHVNNLPQVVRSIRMVALSNKNVSVFFERFDVEDSGCPANPVLHKNCMPLNVTTVMAPRNGNLTLIPPLGDPFGSVELLYIPRRDFVGNDTALIRTCDSEGGCINTILDIEVLFVLYAPYATVTELSVMRDAVLQLNLLTIIHDGARLMTPATVRIVGQPMFGNFTYNVSNGIFTYVPDRFYYGLDNFTLEACNGNASCTNATIQIQVLFKNYAPIANVMNITLLADESTSFNVTNAASDIDDGTWPSLNFSIVFRATKGATTFDPTTGNMTYAAFPFISGNDTFLYQVCDRLGNCTVGQVNVAILPVNHAPMLSPAFLNMSVYKVEEDTSNLLLLYTLHVDPDLPAVTTLKDTDGPPDLLITVLNQTRFGVLTVYAQYGVVAYQPNLNYVGDDSFVYRVCDRCSDLRNTELGRIGSSRDPACARERVRQPLRFARGCLNVTVPLRVMNTNDAIVPASLAGIATSSNVYFDAVAQAYDEDDTQRDIITAKGLNPVDYGLRLVSDIDAASLTVYAPVVGSSALGAGPGAVRTEIVYTQPLSNATGYDTFTYSLCDLQQACVEALVTVLNPSPAPRITNITNHGSCSRDGSYAAVDPMNTNCTGLQSTDMQYGPFDWITVNFDRPTNMAPVGAARVTFPGPDVLRILDFSRAIVRNTSNPETFFGYWVSPVQLIIRIVDPGYPQPKLTSLTIATLNRSSYFCELFNRSSVVAKPTTAQNRRFCLMDAAGTSLQTAASSGLLQGDWGFRLPAISGINVQRPASVDASYFGVGSSLQISAEPPLSADQIMDVCSRGAGAMFDLSLFGENVNVALSCFSQLPDGSLAAVDYTEEEKRCLFEYEDLTRAQQANCDANFAPGSPTIRRRRRALTPSTPTSTVFNLNFLNITNSPLMGASIANLINSVTNSFNVAAIAAALAPSSSGAAQLLAYLAQNPPPGLNASSVYILGSLSETPLVYQAIGSTSGQTDFLTFEFTQETNLPATSMLDYSIAQSDLDLLIRFSPALGTSYSGRWLSRRRLQIAVPTSARNPALIAPQNVSFSFVPGELYDGTTSLDPCRAAIICGKSNQSWGLCNRAGTSCRAYGSFNGTGISGSWSTAASSRSGASESSNLLYLLFLLIGGIVIVFIASRLYKRYKGRQQMKEINRLTRTWRSKFKDEKKDVPFGDSAEVWTRPPGMVSMRNNADPFSNMTETLAPPATNNLPAPPPPLFAPRANPTIAPSPGDVEMSPPLPPLKGAKLSNFMTSPLQLQRTPTLGSINAPALNQPFPRRPSRDLFGSPPPAVLPPTMRRNPTDGARPALPAASLPPLPRPGAMRGDLFGAASGAGPTALPAARALPSLEAVARDPFARPAALGAIGSSAAAAVGGAVAPPTLRRNPSTFGQMQMPQRPSRTGSLGASSPEPKS